VRSKGDVASLNSSSKVFGVAEMNDVVSVSHTAQLAAEIRGKLAEIPNVRTSRLEAIQSQFDSNTYHPDSEVILDRLLREHTQYSGY
jgi:anti-sigma28 factor (negative regulator of flagellin synthesis)